MNPEVAGMIPEIAGTGSAVVRKSPETG